MNFAFHPEAEDEFNEAIEYYEGIDSGIGYDPSGSQAPAWEPEGEAPASRILHPDKDMSASRV